MQEDEIQMHKKARKQYAIKSQKTTSQAKPAKKTINVLQAGQFLAEWKLLSRIDSGGNGLVWKAERNGETCAIKVNKKNSDISSQRFTDEVKVMQSCKDISGIMPILDASLNYSENAEGVDWYAMPLAEPLLKKIQDLTVQEVILLFIPLAETLSDLHGKEVSHRDIKPDNILWVNDRLVFSDFGLAKFPEKKNVTRDDERLGPYWFIAPEMKRNAKKEDGIPADIYSFAKTLWASITKQKLGFDGQYDKKSKVTAIRNFVDISYSGKFDELMTACTDPDPLLRPSSRAVYEGLKEFIEIEKSFEKTNRAQWSEALGQLFPLVLPAVAEWTDISEICTILNILGETENLNHLLLPGGGGMDLERAFRSVEPNCIEMKAGLNYVFSPKRLIFNSFNADAEWFYFRLELSPLKATGIYKSHTDFCEELCEIAPGKYIHRGYYDEGEHNDEPLPPYARVVVRYLEGSMVIFQKTSTYNMNPKTYDGAHNKMTAEKFRELIIKYINFKKSK